MKILKPFWIVSVLLIIITMFLANNSSTSGDEAVQVKIGKNILSYYQTFGADTTALLPDGIDQLQFYGSSFDTFCQFFIQTFDITDTYRFRHTLNGLIGGLIFLFIGLFGRLLKNETVGIIAMILAFFSPHILGQSFNNSKDIPFALGYIMSLYFMSKWFLNPEDVNRKTVVFLILSIALTISIRIGGMILYGYLGLFLLLAVYRHSKNNTFKIYKNNVTIYLSVCILSYFLGLLLWPYGIVSPLKNPFIALAGFEKVDVGINQLFQGIYSDSMSLPFYYLPKLILITTPILIIIGFLIFFYFQIFNILWRKKIIHHLLIFSIFFPLLYIIYKDSNVYGGSRQVLFVYPPILVLSALGIDSVRELLINKLPSFKWLFWIVFFISLNHPIRHIIKNHPYEYIYFNEVFGGVKNAYGNYELDYYYHSTKEATTWLKKYIADQHKTDKDTTLTASNFNGYSYYMKDEKGVKTNYSRFYERNGIDWEYYICINTHIHPYQLKNNFWPPVGTIHTITVDGKPICAIIKRPSRDDFMGTQLLKESKFKEAILYFNNYLKKDSTNCSVLASLAECYINLLQADSSLYYANAALKTHNSYPGALDMLGRVYIINGDIDNAIKTFNNIIRESRNYFIAYYFLSAIYYNKKDYKKALENAELCMSYTREFKLIYNVVGKIKEAQGLYKEAEQYYNMAK